VRFVIHHVGRSVFWVMHETSSKVLEVGGGERKACDELLVISNFNSKYCDLVRDIVKSISVYV
jgi:hypothetical protein